MPVTPTITVAMHHRAAECLSQSRQAAQGVFLSPADVQFNGRLTDKLWLAVQSALGEAVRDLDRSINNPVRQWESLHRGGFLSTTRGLKYAMD